MDTVVLAFVAGVSGSVGPCAAPRYLALARLATGAAARERALTLFAFALGVTSASVLMVESSALIAGALAWSSWLYAALSATFLGSAAWTLLARRRCGSHDTPPIASLGAAFSVGAACALVPSACCTPVLIGLGALSASASLATDAAAGAAFALGHLSALGAVMAVSSPLSAVFSRGHVHEAVQTVGVGLSIALAAYYAVLA